MNNCSDRAKSKDAEGRPLKRPSGVNSHGVAVLQRQVRRGQLLEFIAQLPPCQVAMEACGGAHHWARKIREFGHQPCLIAGQYVKAFSHGQKNDRNDAQSIAMAASQPELPSVAVKSEEQQAVLALHRIRERVKEHIQLTNQLHGLLGEFGFALPKGIGPLRQAVTKLLSEPSFLHSYKPRSPISMST